MITKDTENMEKSVNIYGLVIRTKRVLAALLFIVIGISLLSFGLISFYLDSTRLNSEISDTEVIERAKKLGMIDLKEYLLDKERVPDLDTEDNTVNQ